MPISTSTTTPSTDRIEKQVLLDARRSRVWRALTDVTQLSSWFGVALVTPFAPGGEVSGQICVEGYEHVRLTI